MSALFDRSIRAGTAGANRTCKTTQHSRPATQGARTVARRFAASQGRSLVDCPRRRAYTVSAQRPEGELLDEADVSTQSAPPGEDARVSRAHEDEGRTKGVEAPSCEGPQTADRLSGGLSRRQ